MRKALTTEEIRAILETVREKEENERLRRRMAEAIKAIDQGRVSDARAALWAVL